MKPHYGSCQILVINTENGFKAEGRRQKAEVRRRKKEEGRSSSIIDTSENLQTAPCLALGRVSMKPVPDVRIRV